MKFWFNNNDDDRDEDEEEIDKECDFDVLDNEVAYITGQLYDRRSLNNIHFVADALDALAIMTVGILLEHNGTCRDFLENVSSKANKGGFLHIEVGELYGSNDGSRGSPDHQALLLQYVLR